MGFSQIFQSITNGLSPLIGKMSTEGPEDAGSGGSGRGAAPRGMPLGVAEPAMFLFMLTAMVKFPVFQSLLYEKACLNSGRFVREFRKLGQKTKNPGTLWIPGINYN